MKVMKNKSARAVFCATGMKAEIALKTFILKDAVEAAFVSVDRM